MTQATTGLTQMVAYLQETKHTQSDKGTSMSLASQWGQRAEQGGKKEVKLMSS